MARRLGVFCLCVCLVLLGSGSCLLGHGAASQAHTYGGRGSDGESHQRCLCAQNKPSVCEQATASVSPPVQLDLQWRLLQLRGRRLAEPLQQKGQERRIESVETGRHGDPVRTPGPRPAAASPFALVLTVCHSCHPGNIHGGLKHACGSEFMVIVYLRCPVLHLHTAAEARLYSACTTVNLLSRAQRALAVMFMEVW